MNWLVGIQRRLFVVLVSAASLAPSVAVHGEQPDAKQPQGDACGASWEWTLAFANGEVVTSKFVVPPPLAAYLKDATADALIAWFRTLPMHWKEGDPLPAAPADVPQSAMDDFVVQFLGFLDTINRKVPKAVQDQPGRFAWRDGCGRLLVVLPAGSVPPTPGEAPSAVASKTQAKPAAQAPAAGQTKAASSNRNLPLILSVASLASSAIAGALALSKDGELKKARDALAAIPPGPLARDEFDAQFDSAVRVQRDRDMWRTTALVLGAVSGVATIVTVLRDRQSRGLPAKRREHRWIVDANPPYDGRVLFAWRF